METEEDAVKKTQMLDARERNMSHNVRCTECGVNPFKIHKQILQFSSGSVSWLSLGELPLPIDDACPVLLNGLRGQSTGTS
ncbi:Cytochrome c-type biogenesis protein [Quillaja saponaria]|uniref:Cytochrome c-type biogenesis protein n=1 Tax=Quillaja saponaria TaxID=32244 RepID=A0AAD7L548_QUISA|nr:Cytochrome c-type biogenesis protein [Quillaja saponaria]